MTTDPTDPYALTPPPPPVDEYGQPLYGWWEFVSGMWRWMTDPAPRSIRRV